MTPGTLGWFRGEVSCTFPATRRRRPLSSTRRVAPPVSLIYRGQNFPHFHRLQGTADPNTPVRSPQPHHAPPSCADMKLASSVLSVLFALATTAAVSGDHTGTSFSMRRQCRRLTISRSEDRIRLYRFRALQQQSRAALSFRKPAQANLACAKNG